MAPSLLTFSSVADAATGGPVCRRHATLASGAALRQQPDAGADARVTKDRNTRNATPQPHDSASPGPQRGTGPPRKRNGPAKGVRSGEKDAPIPARALPCYPPNGSSLFSTVSPILRRKYPSWVCNGRCLGQTSSQAKRPMQPKMPSSEPMIS